MAITPAQIRRKRKESLESVTKQLLKLDATVEQCRRFLRRIRRLKKRFPNNDDAIKILDYLGDADAKLDKVVDAAENFQREVSIF